MIPMAVTGVSMNYLSQDLAERWKEIASTLKRNGGDTEADMGAEPQ